ncbi:hypothetical protein BBOV_III007190 [Babesia bovis T2Bo]|uniref:Uncharacterized protein n=1 Tax=Babesia bovis TaxID=5865 RepID=A7ANZ6_BABBO|nr:hypothetical protein BBOV_III007190 [Babesia bovis T2Bo]EDO08280.1 hypothetical protein BBOV_III007190 [Babesia bovis T2Bo]|eukprot:XP_001611848.1 hypothetical protein [Babesia bovis T2Bo]
MDARHARAYDTCLVAPEQGYYSGFAPDGARCVTAVPAQEDGYVLPNGYRFSDGYSLDYQPLSKHVPAQSTFECNPELLQGCVFDGAPQGDYVYPAPEYVQPDYSYAAPGYGQYQQVMGTETVPKVVGDPAPLTTEFFASNNAFQRIPLCPSRSVFRRRRQGDPSSEWSNAFVNDTDDRCDATPCCTG